MVKTSLGQRERRRVFEGSVSLTKNVKDARGKSESRIIERTLKNQWNEIFSVFISVLGCHEEVVENNDNKMIMIINDQIDNLAIEKSQMEKIMESLPENKELKSVVWKAYTKCDKHAIEELKKYTAE